MKEKLSKLINIKSIVTIIVTIVFAILSLLGSVSAECFISIYSIIIGFYFGTQTMRDKDKKDT